MIQVSTWADAEVAVAAAEARLALLASVARWRTATTSPTALVPLSLLNLSVVRTSPSKSQKPNPLVSVSLLPTEATSPLSLIQNPNFRV